MLFYSDAILTDHARKQLRERNIEEILLPLILSEPETVLLSGEKRVVLQKRLFADDLKKLVLYRIIIDTDRTPPEIVTAYRTSKFKKYEA